MSRKDDRTIPLSIAVEVGDEAQGLDLQAFVFDPKGRLVGSAPVEKGRATVAVPAELEARTLDVVVGPRAEGAPTPSAASLERLGAKRQRVSAVSDREIRLRIPPGVILPICFCRVRGRVVKRVTLPDGTVQTQSVCNARVTICEVDPFPFFLAQLSDSDIFRLRDELLKKWRFPIDPPPPPPPPVEGSIPAPLFFDAPPLAETPKVQFSAETTQAALALSATSSRVILEQTLSRLADLIRPYFCDWPWLWRLYSKDCLTTVYADHEGRFETTIFYRCGGDHPDLYFSVEQFQEGTWVDVYRPSVPCGTYWNYDCGSEVTINAPRAEGCVDDDYDTPPGVGLFVLPYAIGATPIWGRPAGSPPAPFGWVKTNGLTDYNASGLGRLDDAPFGGALTFVHDDSAGIPSSGVKYYRYSFRRAGSTDPWTPILTPLSRPYRIEHGNAPWTYHHYRVGPFDVGTETGLFEFKPQTPPELSTDPQPVTAREWVSGNLSEAAAVWNTTIAAPSMGPGQPADRSGTFVVRLEVFDENGVRVMPSPSTFRFLALNEDRATTRFAVPGTSDADPMEVHDGAFHFYVHVDNNAVEAHLPQPSIDGVAASDDCGFLRYDTTPPPDRVLIRFRADHPNDRAVFRFRVKRGSNPPGTGTAPPSGATPSYVEVAATTAYGYDLVGGYYEQDFGPGDLVGTCVNAAFAASLGVYGKATNGWWRLGYDANPWIAFALAQN